MSFAFLVVLLAFLVMVATAIKNRGLIGNGYGRRSGNGIGSGSG